MDELNQDLRKGKLAQGLGLILGASSEQFPRL